MKTSRSHHDVVSASPGPEGEQVGAEPVLADDDSPKKALLKCSRALAGKDAYGGVGALLRRRKYARGALLGYINR